LKKIEPRTVKTCKMSKKSPKNHRFLDFFIFFCKIHSISMSNYLSVRCRILQLIFAGIFATFVIRLLDLQVFQYEQFATEAKSQHEKRSILPARRGKILIRKNRLSGEVSPLATNNTLKMLFVDPLILAFPAWNPNLEKSKQVRGNPAKVAEILAPILIQAHCEAIDGCEIKMNPEEWTDLERASIEAYRAELVRIFSQIERTRVVILTDISEGRKDEIADLQLPGISVENSRVVADPTRILDIRETAEKLSPLLGLDEEQLRGMLTRRYNRYIEITRKISPEVSEKILELKSDERYSSILRGIQLRDEHWRHYPEKSLAAAVVGFVDSNENGQYGIEGRFDRQLRGEEGYIFGATNTRGQRILGREGANFAAARDGVDVLLSIDRVIQHEVEKILENDIVRFDADFGQVIVVEPATGRILAMAQAPGFDPNEFGEAYGKYEITPEQESADREDEFFNQRIPTVSDDRGRLFRYFNLWGPEVFRNKIVSDVYEPGSVMKAITIAAALNADEITPQMTFDDTGPVEVDEFKIRNSDEVYAGKTTMIDVLARSLNTGIAFITQKMGAKLLYESFKNFGFGQFTFIELDGEADGQMEFWKNWEASELVTRGFGQGITVTPLQMAMAFSALANGGYLMKPLLVEELRYPDGRVEKFSPERIRRVISEETYHTIKAMLQNAVNHGIARGARVWGYSVMGKTGTTQTYRNGKALEGAGTTITSFAGFGPFRDPKFVVLVKIDHPKVSQWGSETAAATFRRVAEFLFRYLGVPPDK